MNASPSENLPQVLELWPAGLRPLSSAADGRFPNLTYYRPSSEFTTGQSLLILPGGGYSHVSSAKEGHRPAQLLAAKGLATAVLEYRHAPSRYPVPLLDAQRAMRLLRAKALEFGYCPDKVGVLGFSAGGHLAGLVATQPSHAEGLVGDALDELSPRSNFSALIYPVVSLVADFAHIGSAENLLGQPIDPKLAKQLSIEEAITVECGPFFIAHGQADQAVPPQNALALYAALTSKQVTASLHIYEKAEHGFGLGANHPWVDALTAWLSLQAQQTQKILSQKQALSYREAPHPGRSNT